jgi:hypothetical protein
LSICSGVPPIAVLVFTSALLNNAACDPGPAATQWRRLVGIIITARMDHEGTAMYVGQLESRGSDRCYGLAISAYGKGGEVAEMAFAVRSLMLAGLGWIKMTSRREARNGLAVLHAR